MVNLKCFGKINESTKYKLASSLGALALTFSLLPSVALASEDLTVEYKYTGDMVSLINPTYFDYDYNTVVIKTDNTNINMTREEFEALFNTDEEVITISDGGSTISYDKNDLYGASMEAIENYSPNKEILKKVILNGGVSVVVLGATGLCIYNEFKDRQKKLK